MTDAASMTKDLLQLLPHRAPLSLLDAALDYGDDFAAASVIIKPTSKFFDTQRGGVPAWVGVEYMAQTLAIWVGARQMRMGLPVNEAFLLGARFYKSNVDYFPLDAVLTIHTSTLYQQDAIGSFECRIDSDSGISITARMNAFLPQNPREFANGLN